LLLWQAERDLLSLKEGALDLLRLDMAASSLLAKGGSLSLLAPPPHTWGCELAKVGLKIFAGLVDILEVSQYGAINELLAHGNPQQICRTGLLQKCAP